MLCDASVDKRCRAARETKRGIAMSSESQKVGNRCAFCGGRFGMIRYYSRRTALCSKSCMDRFKSRRDGDRKWLPRCLHGLTNVESPPRHEREFPLA